MADLGPVEKYSRAVAAIEALRGKGSAEQYQRLLAQARSALNQMQVLVQDVTDG